MTEVSEKDEARKFWLRASRSTAIASAALLLLSRGEKASIPSLLVGIGPDWVALNPYVVSLFGIPVLATLCAWTIYAARFYTGTCETAGFPAAAPTGMNLEALSNPRRTRQIAAWSLVIFIGFPLASLGMLEGKLLNGSVYYTLGGPYSCRPDHKPPSDCFDEGSGLSHFRPSHGFRSLVATPYRYEDNKTYLPPWEPAFWLVMGLSAWVYAGLYLLRLFVHPSRSGVKSL